MNDQTVLSKPSVVVDTARLTQRQRDFLKWLRFWSRVSFLRGPITESFILSRADMTGFADPVAALHRLEKRGLVSHTGNKGDRSWLATVVDEQVVSS